VNSFFKHSSFLAGFGDKSLNHFGEFIIGHNKILRMYTTSVTRISTLNLREIILNASKKFQVVDVRDDDYAVGKIVGSINVPSSIFEDKLEELSSNLLKQQKKNVIFHCYYSQVRGPTCANTFKRFVDEKYPDEFNVLVLQGGWDAFQSEYVNDKKLVERI
jgi:rhodanese-related sulfurtransferase